MALSRPFWTAWYRNTEFSIRRACGTRPKLMLLRPRVVKDVGNLSFTSFIPSRVCFPALRNSSSPVASVNVKTSKMNCSGRKPYFFPDLYNSSAVATFCSGVFAIPSGPIHNAIAGIPYLAINGANALYLLPSPSRFIELMIGLPGICSIAVSIT